MEVNITLFVQMVQFFIAYWFLDRYVFVPAYVFIHKEDCAIKNLETKVLELQDSMNAQQEMNQKDWGNIQKKLLSNVSQEIKEVKNSIDLNDVDLYNIECELPDDAVKKGTRFLQERIVEIDKVEI